MEKYAINNLNVRTAFCVFASHSINLGSSGNGFLSFADICRAQKTIQFPNQSICIHLLLKNKPS